MKYPDFHVFTSEYEAEGIGDALYTFIWNIVERVTYRYPAVFYSPNSIWDEDAIGGLCHDFIIEKLLKAGWLEYYLVSLETTGQLHHTLQRDFRHFLINRRKKDEFQNLVRRVRKILTMNSKFMNCSSSNLWGFREWGSRESVQRLEEVVQSMYKSSIPPMTRYNANSRKISHLISTTDLERLLVETISDLERCVDFGLLIQALRYRLNLLDIQEFSLDEALDVDNDNSETYADVIPASQETSTIELIDLAQRIYSQLSVRQQRTLGAYLSFDKPTLDGVSDQLGVSKSTVSNDLNHLQKYIVAAEITEDEAQKVFELLSELCADTE
jgi:hypothetical protein